MKSAVADEHRSYGHLTSAGGVCLELIRSILRPSAAPHASGGAWFRALMSFQGAFTREQAATAVALVLWRDITALMLFSFVDFLVVSTPESDRTIRALVRLSSERGADVAVEVGFPREMLVTAVKGTSMHLDRARE